MPLINDGDGLTTVEFGKGDICIASGITSDSKFGIVALMEQEPKPIGYYVPLDTPSPSLKEYPVILAFENVESIDVLIERLERTKMYMTGERDASNDTIF